MSIFSKFFGDKEKDKRKSHFKNLLAVAFADGKITDEEIAFFGLLARRFYLTDDEVKEIVENPGKVKFTIPEDPREKFDQIYDLVAMMMIDGDINVDEYKICKFIARKFGFDERIVDELIDFIIEAVREKIESETAFAEAKKRKITGFEI